MSDVFNEYLDDAFADDNTVDAVAEPAAAADAATDETPDTAAATDDRPRNPDGTFAARDQPDDVVEQRLKEKDRVIGSMAQELGELRKLVEERTAPKPEPSQYAGQQDLEDRIYENPQVGHQACYDALERGDINTYNRALRAWVEADAPAALLFNQQVLALQMQQQIQQQVAEHVAPAAEVAATSAAEKAIANMRQRYNDFDQVIGSLDQERVHEIASDPDFPAAEYLNRTDLASRQKVLRAIYSEAKLQYGPRVDAANQRAAEEQAAQSAQAKAQAAVATTTTSAGTAPSGTGLFNTGDSDLDAFYEGIVTAGSPFSPGR